MKTEWDYTALADAYLKRPDYADGAVDALLAIAAWSPAGSRPLTRVCDVGAGVAHLTLMLAARGLAVTAVEPNDAMRRNGTARTAHLPGIQWHEGTGEATGQGNQAFDLVTFGSSFNVCDRPRALAETARILVPGGSFACLWNHRRLDDPIQAEIEAVIRRRVASYGYGTRREDQTEVIDQSGLFGPVVHLDAGVIHEQSIVECVEAWRSHATLARQAGADFPQVVADIEAFLKGLGRESIEIPYTTNVWVARLR